MKNLILKSSFHEKLKMLLVLIGVLIMSVSQVYADPWVKSDIPAGSQGTKTVGDAISGSEWWYNFQTNGGWSSATDIQVIIGTSSSSYSTRNASWYADSGSDKKVHADISSFTFDKSGIWYAVGKYYSSSKTAYTSGTSFTNNSSLSTSMSKSNSPYWTVNPPSVKSFTVSTTGSDIISGDGTSGNPYLITNNGSLKLSLSGSKNTTDANSSLQYNTNGTWNTTTTTRTISNITNNNVASVTVKMRCYNATASLSGTESTKTIYYKVKAQGFESSDNGIKYWNGSSNVEWKFNGQTAQTKDLSSVTSLYLKEWFVKLYENWDGAKGNVKMQYNIHRTADAAGEYTDIAKNWTDFGSWEDGWAHPKYGHNNQNINLLEGLGSGKYTMSFKYNDSDLGITSSVHSLNWQIDVPAMATHTVTSDGTGDGSSGTPFSVAVGGDLTITVSGTQASSDANSVLYVSFDGGTSYSTTKTYTINSITSSKLSLSIKAKYRNNNDNIDGTVYDFGNVYYQGTLTPSLAISSFTQNASAVTAANSGTSVTINASRQNAGTATITYAYSTDNSNWTTIASTTNTSQSWTLPAVTSTTTYYVKASMTYSSTAYSDTQTFTVYGKKIINVKNTNNWSSMFMHRWDGAIPGTSWPGDATQISDVAGQWKQVVLYSSNDNFALVDGSNSNNHTADQTYAGMTDGNCYEIQSGTGGSLTLTSVSCPSEPSVTTASASSVATTSATFNASGVNANNDAITEYGFKWGTTSDCSSGTVPASNLGAGTTFSASKTDLTNGTTYYYKAYATNGFGTTYGSVQSFRTKYVTTVTLNPQGGTGGTASVTATEGSAMPSGQTAPGRTGYTFGGYYANAGGSGTQYYSATMTSAHNWDVAASTAEIHAKWTAIHYPITYELNGGSKEGLVPWNPDTYTIEQNVPAFKVAPERNGYTFAGWYTDIDLTTPISTPYVITIGTTGAKTYYAKWTPNAYTVTFDVNGSSDAPPSPITVTYDAAYGELPAGPTPPGAEAFAGWFTAQTGGTQVTPETIVSTASEHTLWARFESTFAVTVQYKCGSDVLRAQTTTQASEVSVAGSLNAPEIIGYTFSEWTGDNATFADKNAASTTVHVTAATTVVANYVAHPTLYFKNNLSWDDVYVTFDCNWVTAGGKQVPGNYGKPYFKMTQLGNSDIFYCAIPDTYTSSDYAGWKNNIAFDNHGFSSSDNKGTKTGGFDAGAFLGRGDFDPLATMFIPYDGDTESRNSGTYYRTGCWLRYNSTSSGYRVQVNEWKEGEHADSYLVDLTSDVAGGTEFKATVHMDAQPSGYEYGFKLYKHYQKNGNAVWYSNTGDIHPSTNTLPWHFWADDVTATSRRCGLEKEANGDYVFTVSFGTGRPVVNVTYPVSAGDYQLVYKDRATWSNSAHDANWNHPSRIIKATANATDIISFFVSKETGADASVKLYKCTSISGNDPVWDSGTDVDISSISTTGVYNFSVTQNASKVATVSVVGEYTGNYYIRSDASDGGWSHYKTSGANNMTYTEYSLTHGGDFGPYSHYFMRHVNSGSNIKFCIANDYSQCISDTVVDDTYAHEWIEAEANIRFMWYNGTNKIGRAYISGSSIVSDRFLVLEGDESLFDADGHPLRGDYQVEGLNEDEMNFTDDQNWVYETTVQAKPNERVKLTAKFNGKIQYFYGAEGERSESTTYQLIGGTGSTMYKMRVVYDFKTNRLLAAWLPNGDISDPTPINADVMIIRYHQDDAQQITFSDDGKLTDVKTVYGAMEFNKYRLNNQRETYPHEILGISNYERDLFFISFPFDVKLNDVFGFGQYGKHWIIEYYDGKTRAQKGYWIDSPTNWKFVTKAMKDSYTLKANEGYVLALDLDELTLESPVWNYGVENVYLYFPSTATVENIQATTATVKIDTVGYQCTINRDTPHGDRRVKDSHWHLIGVPSYANANHSTSNSWETDTDLEQTIYYPDIDPAAWTSAAPFVYHWDASLNKFGVVRATSYSFKPMHSYLVQYARDTLEWRQVNAPGVAAAPKRAMFAKEPCDFRLELLQDENVIDQAFISMRDDEEVTAEFDFNYDLSKMLYGAFTSKSNIYTFAGNEEVAANCLPYKDETTIVPVGLTVDEEGEYIFSIPEGTNGVGVTLVDNERQTRTNLALTDYATYIAAGTHDERFVIEISPIEQIVTNVELINGENGDAALNGEKVTGVCKKLIDGVLYIIKDGKVFDARGARIQ